jgi:hypothetical protein
MSSAKDVSIDRIVDLLNEVIKLDSEAAQKLFNFRVPCNNEILNHPTIQVNGDDPQKYTVSFLGILNGIFPLNSKGYGYLCIHIDDNGKIEKFSTTE